MKNLSTKQKLIFVAIAIVLVYFMISVANFFINSGKTKVTIEVAPEDSIVYVDGKKFKAGSLYLDRTSHAFVAKRDGFKDDVVTIVVGQEPARVGLLPFPNTDEAKKYLRLYPEVQQQRESIDGANNQGLGTAIVNQTPLIKLLPSTNINAPYVIDFGPSKTRTNGTVIYIGDSTSEGRISALKWIRAQGYNPSDLEIVFSDFSNPITQDGPAL